MSFLNVKILSYLENFPTNWRLWLCISLILSSLPENNPVFVYMRIKTVTSLVSLAKWQFGVPFHIVESLYFIILINQMPMKTAICNYLHNYFFQKQRKLQQKLFSVKMELLWTTSVLKKTYWMQRCRSFEEVGWPSKPDNSLSKFQFMWIFLVEMCIWTFLTSPQLYFDLNEEENSLRNLKTLQKSPPKCITKSSCAN